MAGRFRSEMDAKEVRSERRMGKKMGIDGIKSTRWCAWVGAEAWEEMMI